MKALWRRLFGRKDDLDDATTAYIEGRANPAEFDAVQQELDESPERGRDIEELRQTVALLRSVETPPAPRSFALTPDMVPEQRPPFRLDLSYAPAAAAAALVLAVGVLIAGDLTDLVRQSESGGIESMSAPAQFADSEQVAQDQPDTVTVAESVVERAKVQQEAAPESQVTAPGAPGEPGAPGIQQEAALETPVTEAVAVDTATPAPAMTQKVVETVVVEKVAEKKVVETVVVEKEAAVAKEAVETVTVEKPVAMQAAQESDQPTARIVVEISETPAGAIAVEASSIEDSPGQETATPVALSARAPETTTDDGQEIKPTTTTAPVPTPEPTPQPTATPTPRPTETPAPTATPTATPVPTATATPEPTASPIPTPEPTPRPIPTPVPHEEPATADFVRDDEDPRITLPLWQLQVLLAVLALFMVALWAVLRRRHGREI